MAWKPLYRIAGVAALMSVAFIIVAGIVLGDQPDSDDYGRLVRVIQSVAGSVDCLLGIS